MSPEERQENDGEENTTRPSPDSPRGKVTRKASAFVLLSLESISALVFNHFFPPAFPPHPLLNINLTLDLL